MLRFDVAPKLVIHRQITFGTPVPDFFEELRPPGDRVDARMFGEKMGRVLGQQGDETLSAKSTLGQPSLIMIGNLLDLPTIVALRGDHFADVLNDRIRGARQSFAGVLLRPVKEQPPPQFRPAIHALALAGLVVPLALRTGQDHFRDLAVGFAVPQIDFLDAFLDLLVGHSKAIPEEFPESLRGDRQVIDPALQHGEFLFGIAGNAPRVPCGLAGTVDPGVLR